MRTTLSIAAIMIVWMCVASAQEPQQPAQTSGAAVQPDQQQRAVAGHRQWTRQKTAGVRTSSVKKTQPVPSIIQSELDRSRAEVKQPAPSSMQMPARLPAPSTPVWPLFVSLGTGMLATAGLLVFFFRRKQRQLPSAPSAQPMAERRDDTLVAPVPPPAAERMGFGESDEFDAEVANGRSVTSSSPFVYEEDESEMPEAALTMNLLNKKRETKKEVILEVMKRVQRKEKPQQIAETLRIGIGEVHLAMTLAKLKK